MHPENTMELGTGRIYINNTEYVGIGLTDYDYSEFREKATDYIKRNMVVRSSTGASLTFQMKVSYIALCKVMGIWDWVLENCRDGRVKHLMRRGKNERIRKKNFKRAVHLIAKNVYVKEK